MQLVVVSFRPSPSHPAARSARQIVFESSLDAAHDVGNDCLMSIDGTDFRVKQQGPAVRGNPFGSHKYAGQSALHYELGIDILAENLVWVGGPYPARAWPDIKIFFNELAFSSQAGGLKPTTAMWGTRKS